MIPKTAEYALRAAVWLAGMPDQNESADHLEAVAWDERVSCRSLAGRSKPPRRYSPRFEKKRTGGHNGAHRRGGRRPLMAH